MIESLKEPYEKTGLWLEALKVNNEIIWVNPQIKRGNLPFNFKEGAKTNIAALIINIPSHFRNRIPRKARLSLLAFSPPHQRSAILGHVIFEDSKGRVYRDIDLKGVGYILQALKGRTVIIGNIEIERRRATEPRALGIAYKSFVLTDIEYARRLASLGVRTHLPLAIIELKELPDPDNPGRKISIEEAVKRKMIHEGEIPVIEVRAYSVKSRVQDLEIISADFSSRIVDTIIEGLFEIYQKDIIENLVNIFEKERKRISTIGNFSSVQKREAYLWWFTKEFAENLAIIHGNNLIHGFISGHNITLDAGITDLDSMFGRRPKSDNDESLYIEEIESALFVLFHLIRSLGYLFIKESSITNNKFEKNFWDEAKKLFIKTYENNCGDLVSAILNKNKERILLH